MNVRNALPAPRDSEPVGLAVDGVTLRFAGVTALDHVSFVCAPGELVALIGPNGAGKTSILNCINGVYHPEQGSIRLGPATGGREIIGMSPHEIAGLGVARVFQNVELFAQLSVAENITLGRHRLMRTGALAGGLWIGRAAREEVRHRRSVEQVIQFLEIESIRDQRVANLPYGLRKRVGLGLALAMEPRLLLLDEPVAGMNLEETFDLARFILDIREELGISMLLVEHAMALVMDLADRVVVFDFGQVIADAEPSAVQRDPAVIRAYLGGAG